MKGEKGVAVIMAMWLLAVLAIIGTTFIFMMRLEPMIARYHRDDMKALYIAQAGIDHAVYILKQDVGGTVDHLGEAWAQGLTNEPLLDEEGNIVGYYTVEIQDESGKTNLNTAPKSHLMGLELMTEVRADALITYRGGTYKPLETVDELLCVPEITQTVFDRNREIITVYTDGLVNLNTASYSVLKGIEDGEGGLASDDVTSIITYRGGTNGPFDTPTPPPDGTTEKATEVNNASAIDNAETEYLTGEDASGDVTNTTKRVSVKSNGLFTIISTAGTAVLADDDGIDNDGDGEIDEAGELKILTTKKLRVVVNREKVTPAVESRIEYYREVPEE